ADRIANQDDSYRYNAAVIHERLANWCWARHEVLQARDHFEKAVSWDPTDQVTRAKAALAKGVAVWEEFHANRRSTDPRTLSEAVSHLEAAKRLFTSKDNPAEWATICAHLGMIYGEI